MSNSRYHGLVLIGFVAVATLAIVPSCAAPPPDAVPEPGAANPTTAPADLLGTFEDDYGIRYTISSTSSQQGSGVEYHVVAWTRPAGR